MPGIVRSTIRLTAWSAGLLLAGRLLYGAGSGTVGLRIPLTSITDARTWLADTPPPTMAMAVVRLLALGAVAYLLAATALAVAANLVGARPLQAAAQRLTPALVRRVATGGGGVGLALGAGLGAFAVPDLAPHPIVAAAAAAGAAEAAPAPAAPDVATMIRYDLHLATMTRVSDPPDPGTSAAPAAAPSAAEPGSGPGPEETGATPGPGTSSSGPTGPPGGGAQPGDGGDGGDATGAAELPPLTATMIRTDGAPAPAVGPMPSSLPQTDETWVVQPGDSFWSIAEDVLGSPGGVPPGERDVGRYWCRLIGANRARLVDPGNPDLLVPGQELVVPPP